jgi:hypothetical protein
MTQPRCYPPEALALFADYRDRREPHRPPECDEGAQCWVRDGPPSISHSGYGGRCIGCDAPPRPVISRRTRGNADGPL